MTSRATPWSWLLASALVIHGCGGGDPAATLLVRSTMPEEFLTALEASFEARHPDIDVRYSDAPLSASLAALEAGDAEFDVLLGAPGMALVDAGIDWDPWLRTPLVVAFDRRAVPLAKAPTDWIDVFHHAWFDDVRAPDPVRTDAGAALVGAMVVESLRNVGDDLDGFDWLTRLHRQVDGYSVSSADMVAALGAGDALLAIMPRADAEMARSGQAPWLHYRIPTSGTPELVLGITVGGASEPEGAVRAFLEYLASDEVATISKIHTHWEPARGEIDDTRLPPDFELAQRWTPYEPAMDTLAALLDGWIDRWEREIRTVNTR